jgi:predicted AAA+ superfamily ATPase
VNEGALAEQFIGQHLAFLDPGKPSLHYWLREGKSENAEVDYVVAEDGKILPIEVKAGAAVHFELLSLPLYAVEAVGRHSLFSLITKNQD